MIFANKLNLIAREIKDRLLSLGKPSIGKYLLGTVVEFLLKIENSCFC